MVKPVILSVDDDASVLRAITRDLRSRYGSEYRVIAADSGPTALSALRELQKRNDPVALFLVDQRMPQMGGVDFLAQAIPLYPEAKRALLTAYADTDAAINAINTAAVHYYLLKPWDPPEEKLYPIIDDLLTDWQGDYRPPFSGIRIIGHRWSPQTHEVKDFLARNQVPYHYLDIEQEPEAQQVLTQFALDETKLPVLILLDGQTLVMPTINEVAEKVGLQRHAVRQFYDLAIVGGGPGGLAAAVYGASEGLSTVMVEKQAPGGQAGTSSRIENYLGFPSGLSGADLARRATVQAKRFGVEILAQEVVSLRVDGPYRIIKLADDSEIACHALVVAAGLTYRKLAVPGAEKVTGAGVYYGASLTEVVACRDQATFIVGAGNSAGQAALYLAQYANKVTILVRGDSLEAKMSQYLVARIYEHPKIEVRVSTNVTACHGEEHLTALTICDDNTGQETVEEAAALFVFIGAIPSTQWLQGAVQLDAHGFVCTGSSLLRDGKAPKGWPLERDPFLLEASVPGIFVVGDVRATSIKRVASAVGEGSIAVQFVHQYLSRLK
ncbi:MAG: FAD-dependent oxidoreductase [Chloroflexi bacterium]|nr:FAD-dependent oxidoreductase [Chloroflexota bacterium]